MLKRVRNKKKKNHTQLIFRLGVNTTLRDTNCSFIAGLSYEFVDITTAEHQGYSSTCFSVCCFYLPSGLWSVTTSTAWRLLRSHCMRCETATMHFSFSFFPPLRMQTRLPRRPPTSIGGWQGYHIRADVEYADITWREKKALTLEERQTSSTVWRYYSAACKRCARITPAGKVLLRPAKCSTVF